MAAEPSQLGIALPRPGKALRAMLVVLAAMSVVSALVVHWIPGPPRGVELFGLLTFDAGQRAFYMEPWRIVTSGLLTSPIGISHTLFTLLGLYFLGADLERRWGGARLLRLLLIAVVTGNLLAWGLAQVFPSSAVLRGDALFGPEAALVATAVAWGRENPTAQIRLFFFLPVTGTRLIWVTLGFCALGLVYTQSQPEGVVAPFGGALVGMLLGGTPSPVRRLFLRARLGVMRKRGPVLTVESLLDDDATARPVDKGGKGKGGKAPALRVVYGGLEDDPEGKKAPKDKRWLN
ncbi:MAG: rhomboid family intramembrane serine protease [Myxococcales bacterium]|jgi:membrane associated rhomboid family serine protease|nr:rhomboid family intramembrane serine protease [Myxococcales bacterium]HQY63384.1 rhomboid family intramembrane serine protease [Polyangiaceae bacterium]